MDHIYLDDKCNDSIIVNNYSYVSIDGSFDCIASYLSNFTIVTVGYAHDNVLMVLNRSDSYSEISLFQFRTAAVYHKMNFSIRFNWPYISFLLLAVACSIMLLSNVCYFIKCLFK